MTPLILALSASAPIINGYLSGSDCRWEMVSAANDERTDQEIADPKVPAR